MIPEQDFTGWSRGLRGRLERFLADALPAGGDTLAQAMRYAVLGGGKRVRALMVFAAGELTEAPQEALDPAAAAIELVHAYSLIHDDLPCMDNDVLRRGQPTCHVKFGYAEAMLAGDALQPLAFELIAAAPVPDAVRVALTDDLARASGWQGMCGGQMIDLMSVGRSLSAERLREMHRMKTGALIRASLVMGARCGRGDLFESVIDPLGDYADSLGLAYQVVDDILDVTGDTATLGKTRGKDEAADKPTYVSILGLDESRRLARQCRLDAREALGRMGPGLRTGRLEALADYIIGRDH